MIFEIIRHGPTPHFRFDPIETAGMVGQAFPVKFDSETTLQARIIATEIIPPGSSYVMKLRIE